MLNRSSRRHEIRRLQSDERTLLRVYQMGHDARV